MQNTAWWWGISSGGDCGTHSNSGGWKSKDSQKALDLFDLFVSGSDYLSGGDDHDDIERCSTWGLAQEDKERTREKKSGEAEKAETTKKDTITMRQKFL